MDKVNHSARTGSWFHTASRKLGRGPKATKRAYPLRGCVRCGYCSRRMEGIPRKSRTYYRCASRSLIPGSAALHGHPKNVVPGQQRGRGDDAMGPQRAGQQPGHRIARSGDVRRGLLT